MEERRSHISAWSALEERRRGLGGLSDLVLSCESLRELPEDLRDALDDLREVRQSSLDVFRERRSSLDDLREVRQSSGEGLGSSCESLRFSWRWACEEPSMSHLLKRLSMASMSSSTSLRDEFRDWVGDRSSSSSMASSSSSSSSASDWGGDGGCTTMEWGERGSDPALSKLSSRGLACRADRLVGLKSRSGLMALGLWFRDTFAVGMGRAFFRAWRPRGSPFSSFSYNGLTYALGISFPCSSLFSSASETSDLKALCSFRIDGPGDRLRLRFEASSRPALGSRSRNTLLHDGRWLTDDWRRLRMLAGMMSGSAVVKLTRLVVGVGGCDVAMVSMVRLVFAN